MESHSNQSDRTPAANPELSYSQRKEAFAQESQAFLTGLENSEGYKEATLRLKNDPARRLNNGQESAVPSTGHSKKIRRLNPPKLPVQDQSETLHAEIKTVAEKLKDLEHHLYSYHELTFNTYPNHMRVELQRLEEESSSKSARFQDMVEGDLADIRDFVRGSIALLKERVDKHEELLQISNHQMKLQHEITQCLFEAQYTVARQLSYLGEIYVPARSSESAWSSQWEEQRPEEQSEKDAEMPEEPTETEVENRSDTLEYVVLDSEEEDDSTPPYTSSPAP